MRRICIFVAPHSFQVKGCSFVAVEPRNCARYGKSVECSSLAVHFQRIVSASLGLSWTSRTMTHSSMNWWRAMCIDVGAYQDILNPLVVSQSFSQLPILPCRHGVNIWCYVLSAASWRRGQLSEGDIFLAIPNLYLCVCLKSSLGCV